MACKAVIRLCSSQLSKPISTKYFNAPKNIFKPIGIRFLSQSTDIKPPEATLMRVYTGELSSRIKSVKIFSLTTSLMGLAAQPLLYNALATANNMPLLICGSTFIGFFTFLTPFLLNIVTKKYVLHLDYNEEKKTYIATIYNFFCIPKQIEFSPDDVIKPEIPRMFTTCYAKGKPIFLDENVFAEPIHYSRIMGYDKPFNLEMYEIVKEKKM